MNEMLFELIEKNSLIVHLLYVFIYPALMKL